MLVYDYECGCCGRVLLNELVKTRDEIVTCECGELMARQFAIPARFQTQPVMDKLNSSDGLYLEHVSAKGETFTSKRQMQEYAKKHNLQLGALL